MTADPHQDKHATVGEPYATSELAYTVLRQLLPAKWIVRNQAPDFHIDFLIEPTEAGELTGINVALQLKGWVPKKKGADKPAYSLKTKHLIYYLEKCELPVFLVLIDVTNRRGYWVFMQQFGQALNRGQLRKQKRLLVRFSPENTLADTPRLTEAILDSVKFMHDLRPSSVDAALSQRKKELEAKDKRVEVQVDLVGGRQHIILSAKEQFPFTLKFNTTDPKTIRAIRDFYEKDADLSIKRDEVEFKGCPLFDELGTKKDEKLLIQHGKDVEGHALFSWEGAGPESQVHVPGTFRTALKYLTFSGVLPSSPFKVATSIPWTLASAPEPFSMSLEFHPKAWQHQRLVALPHFASIYAFFSAALSGKDIVLGLYVQGNLVGMSNMSGTDLRTFEPALALLETLNKAKALAQHFKVDPVLPAFSPAIERNLNSIDELHAVLFSKEHRAPSPNIKISFKGVKTAPGESLDKITGPLIVVVPSREYPIFDQRVQLGPIQTELTRVRLARQLPSAEPGWLNLELVGTEDCERIVRHKGIVYASPPASE